MSDCFHSNKLQFINYMTVYSTKDIYQENTQRKFYWYKMQRELEFRS